jgi:signal transduction histidine kinase
VNDLLVLARADAGRSLAKESFSVLPVLDETCRQVRQLDPLREIRLQAALSNTDSDVSILGDRDAFKQVLLVALDNALKHTQGKVSVRVARLAGQVEIRVLDEGQGMSVAKLEHLFDRFYRGEDSSTIPGFGLGLPIARSLVNAMGGEIRMESEPGSGSTLVMTFGASAG